MGERRDSNPRRLEPQSSALPTELRSPSGALFCQREGFIFKNLSRQGAFRSQPDSNRFPYIKIPGLGPLTTKVLSPEHEFENLNF